MRIKLPFFIIPGERSITKQQAMLTLLEPRIIFSGNRIRMWKYQTCLIVGLYGNEETILNIVRECRPYQFSWPKDEQKQNTKEISKTRRWRFLIQVRLVSVSPIRWSLNAGFSRVFYGTSISITSVITLCERAIWLMNILWPERYLSISHGIYWNLVSI